MSEEHSEADDLQVTQKDHVSKIGTAIAKIKSSVGKIIHEAEGVQKQHEYLVEKYKKQLGDIPTDDEFPHAHVSTIENGVDQLKNVLIGPIETHSSNLIESTNVVASSAKRLASIERRIKLQTEEIEANIKAKSVETYPMSRLPQFIIALGFSTFSLMTALLYGFTKWAFETSSDKAITAMVGVGYLCGIIFIGIGMRLWDDEDKERMKGFKELFPEWKKI